VADTAQFVAIISAIQRDYWRGKLVAPEREKEFVSAMCDRFVVGVPTSLRDAVRASYDAGLASALHVIRAQDAAQFLN
jgi:hypothetical protein